LSERFLKQDTKYRQIEHKVNEAMQKWDKAQPALYAIVITKK
jgi:hypothetical protein